MPQFHYRPHRLASYGVPEDEKITEYALAMKQSVRRMSRLTKQLLACAGRGNYFSVSISLNNFVEDSMLIIQRILDPDIHLETDLPSDVMNVEVDSAQMQMVLKAIVANSNEAIEGSGHVTISTKNMDLDQGFIEDHPWLRPGPYVCLSIEDDGKGMDDVTRERLFDPFFTTHFIGRGLGMASVYGIVRNHNGSMSVDSKPGKKTVVRIYLPAIETQEGGGQFGCSVKKCHFFILAEFSCFRTIPYQNNVNNRLIAKLIDLFSGFPIF